jgi:hypothetical protein
MEESSDEEKKCDLLGERHPKLKALMSQLNLRRLEAAE